MNKISMNNPKAMFSKAMKKCSFICAVFVMFIHAYNLEVYDIGADSSIYWIERFCAQNITVCAVPFFFMSSAFFLYQKARDTASVYKSRFKSIVLPYLMWNTIFMIAFSVLKRLSLSKVGLDRINIIDILKGIFLYRYNYVYWFMFQLIIFTLLYPVIKQIVCRNKAVCFSGLAVLLLIQFAATTNQNIVNSFVYYYMGAICGCYYKEQIERIAGLKGKKKAVLMMIFIAAFGLCVVANESSLDIGVVKNLILIVLLFLISSFPKEIIPQYLLKLSFMIYSLHSIILECVEKIVYIVFPHNALWASIDYFMAPIVTLLIIVAICAAMNTICPRFYRMLNGGRP